MDSIGAEVGQKMRSAIKAKLTELGCTADNDLTDYIMVMVANKRGKSQMSSDLQLFLTNRTTTFVNWLHIVLKKLKEVAVTNPDVYKKAMEKSNSDQPAPADDKTLLNLKRETLTKKLKKENEKLILEQQGSITDNLPILPNRLSENRRIICDEQTSNENIVDDNFDIPLLSDVRESANEESLQEIERKIRNVKTRLGLQVDSDDDLLNDVKSENGDKESNNFANARKIDLLDDLSQNSEGQVTQENGNLLFNNKDIDADNERSLTPPLKNNVPPRYQHERICFEEELAPVKSRLDRPSRSERDLSRDRARDRSRDRSPLHRSPRKKGSILERLGKRLGSPGRSGRFDRSGRDFRKKSSSRERNVRPSDHRHRDRRERVNSRERNKSRSRSPLRKDRDSKREGILSRLGVQSKVAVIKKVPVLYRDDEDEEDARIVREVQSSIKVKPRVIPDSASQPNKNLLLKAVADAQRSIAQTPTVGKDVLIADCDLRKYPHKRTLEENASSPRRLMERKKSKIEEIIRKSSSKMRSRLRCNASDEEDIGDEYIPEPVNSREKDVPCYIPSSKHDSETDFKENQEDGQQFIITLDGAENLGIFKNKMAGRLRLDNDPTGKHSSSPIVFEKPKKMESKKIDRLPNVSEKMKKSSTLSQKVKRLPTVSENVAKVSIVSDIVEKQPITSVASLVIPDRLVMIHAPVSVKNKDRCKYWPNCRQGEKCEFLHPTIECQMFPSCKYGESCLFLHPNCKFGSACTKRGCPYNHNKGKTIIGVKLPSAPLLNCKYFPNCINMNCPFYHPKQCKFGKYCTNAECNFSHPFTVNKKNMVWRSK